jgi:hypothetical protein
MNQEDARIQKESFLLREKAVFGFGEGEVKVRN